MLYIAYSLQRNSEGENQQFSTILLSLMEIQVWIFNCELHEILWSDIYSYLITLLVIN